MQPLGELGQWGLTRRRALIAGAGAVAIATGLATSRGTRAQAVRTGGGIAGGGEVKDKDARAQFSIFASRFESPPLTEPYFVGLFQLADEHAKTVLASTKITSYGPIGNAATDREVRGVTKVNDEGGHPFVVRLQDLGGPGSGKDTIAVFVGKIGAQDATTDPMYHLAGTIDCGDIELFQIPLPF
jgi:hypothetical protein